MSNVKGIAAAVRANGVRPEAERMTVQELAVTLGVEPARVWEAMSRERRKGRIPESARQVAGAVAVVNGTAKRGTSPEELLEVLQRGDVLGRDERLRLTSHLARTGPAPVTVNAVRLLDELDPHPAASAAPLDPFDDDDYVERLSALMI